MALHAVLVALAIFATNVHGLYPSSSDVVDLTPSNFDRLVLQSDSIWIVEFFAPWCGHCQQLVPEYTKLASALKGIAKVGAVNADEHRSLGEKYGVRGFPTLKIFNKGKPEDYQGGRTAKVMADAILKAARSRVDAQLGGGTGGSSGKSSGSNKDVVELTDSNFDSLVLNSEEPWLVEFFAPWCGHCKNLAPHWAEAATKLKGKVKLGALDATANSAKANQFGVQGYPTIKFFPAGKKTSSSAEEYDGGRTASDIVTWASDKAAASLPPPEVVEVVNEKILKAECESKPLCVVSILPHILDCDAKCRNGYIKMLKKTGEKFKQKQWGWVWSEAGSQTKLEESLGIGGFGYPAMSIINVKKGISSTLRGSFGEEGVSEFLREVSYGGRSVTTSPLRGVDPGSLPKVYDTTPWDGKDGQLPTEEDLDLSDVDLDDLEKQEL